MSFSKEIILEMYEEGCRLQNRYEQERRCEYCHRWLKSKRGKNIHLYYCKTKKLVELLEKTRKKNISYHFLPSIPNIDNRIRNITIR